MDYSYMMKMMEMAGIHPMFGIPTSIFPRFPPGISQPTMGLVNQKKLKERFFNDNSSLNIRLQDFNQFYHKLATGLLEVATPAFPPGHPLYSRVDSNITLQNENDKLKKENLELKKQISKKSGNQSKI